MKALALDLGDVWTGTALSDPLKITARPHKTVATRELHDFLGTLFAEERIDTVVLGYPKTMKGTESDQTRKIKVMGKEIEEKFPDKNYVWWDERLTSQQADKIKRPKSKADKQESHSVAAALVLMGYLDSLNF